MTTRPSVAPKPPAVVRRHLALPSSRRGVQVIWAGWGWPLVAFRRLDPDQTHLAVIYSWILLVGPVAVRRWAK